MVMAAPSPQQVGREFVRQYYTVLHEAPDILHRFYSSGSTFVHGAGELGVGLDEEPVFGQLEIDKKIRTLGFKDCHTKIRQVDSQATIGNGVVVQVTGELSNNGEPMRRFMQTFVLAPQTPKKFYVHNDIFRYQDEIFQDNSDTESEDPSQQQHQHQQHHHQQQQLHAAEVSLSEQNASYYQEQHQQAQVESSEIDEAAINDHHSAYQTTASAAEASSYELASSSNEQQQLLSGHEVEAEQAIVDEPPQTQYDQYQHVDSQVAEADQSAALLNGHADSEQQIGAEQTTVAGTRVLEPELSKESKIQSVVAPEVVQSRGEPKSSSWAKIIGGSSASVSAVNQSNLPASSSNFEASFSSSQAQANSNSQSFSKPPKQAFANKQHQQASYQNGSAAPSYGSKGSGIRQKAPQQQQQQQLPISSDAAAPSSAPAPKRTVYSAAGEQTNSVAAVEHEQVAPVAFDKRGGGSFGSARYPDGQQVFVGNLSAELSDAELRAFFSQFGKVVEIRINVNTKQHNGRRLPNYGFIVFDERQSVEKLLAATKNNSLTYKSAERGGAEYRLNIEEKRARSSMPPPQQQQQQQQSAPRSNQPRPNRSTSDASRNDQAATQNGTAKKSHFYQTNEASYGNYRKEESDALGNQQNYQQQQPPQQQRKSGNNFATSGGAQRRS